MISERALFAARGSVIVHCAASRERGEARRQLSSNKNMGIVLSVERVLPGTTMRRRNERMNVISLPCRRHWMC